MDRRDWLLLLLALKGAHGTPALDPVRIQKGMFLLGQEGELSPEQTYDFEPLHYGPYSRQLRRDTESLVNNGLLKKEAVPGYTWSMYRLTPTGLERAQQLLQEAPRPQVELAYRIKQEITGVPFSELLKGVYDKYPDYAVNSVFSG